MAKLAKKDPFWCKLDSQTMQAISQKYTDALSQHFKQKGVKRGFPRLHKKHILGSVLFKQSGYKLYVDQKGRGVLVINKLKNHGTFRFKITRPWYTIKTVTVKRDNDNSLYVVICCDVPKNIIESAEIKYNRGAIGIDFGMKTFLTTSLGEEINIPDYHKQCLDEIRKADRPYSHKRNAKIYGTSFKRAKKHRMKVHRRIADKRADFHWKLAHKLCREYSFIAIEDLNLNGMKMHKNWGRKISSLGYGEFVQKLMVVAERYNTTIYKIGRYEASSQICSVCGYRNTEVKDLSVRSWVCPECGTMHDRDINAARNILDMALDGKDKNNGKGISHGCSGSKTLQADVCNAAVLNNE